MNLIKRAVNENRADLEKDFETYQKSVKNKPDYKTLYQKVSNNLRQFQQLAETTHKKPADRQLLDDYFKILDAKVFYPYEADKNYLSAINLIKTYKIADSESFLNLSVDLYKKGKEILKRVKIKDVTGADNDAAIISHLQGAFIVFISQVIKSIYENAEVNSGENRIDLKDEELSSSEDRIGKDSIMKYFESAYVIDAGDTPAEKEEVFQEYLDNKMITKEKINGKDTYVMRKNLTERLSKHKIFPAGLPLPQEVEQGQIGDCYLLSTLITLAKNNPKAISDCFLQKNFDAKENLKVKLYKIALGEKVGVVPKGPVIITVGVSSLLAKGTKRTGTNIAIWPAIFEKAFVAYYKKFPEARNAEQALKKLGEGDATAISMSAITGKKIKVLDSSVAAQALKGSQPGVGTQKNIITDMEMAKIYDKISKAIAKKEPVTAGKSGHAYAVLDTKEKSGDKYVILQDPYKPNESIEEELSEFLKTYSDITKGSRKFF